MLSGKQEEKYTWNWKAVDQTIFCDRNWVKIDELNLKKWSAHGRTGLVWRYMTSKGVKNFCPDDPTDIEKWQDGLTQEQVIDTMQ